jgi:hypothetical protein
MKKILMLTLVAWLVACAGPSAPVLPPFGILGRSAEVVSTMTTAQFYLYRWGAATLVALAPNANSPWSRFYFVVAKGGYKAPNQVVITASLQAGGPEISPAFRAVSCCIYTASESSL